MRSQAKKLSVVALMALAGCSGSSSAPSHAGAARAVTAESFVRAGGPEQVEKPVSEAGDAQEKPASETRGTQGHGKPVADRRSSQEKPGSESRATQEPVFDTASLVGQPTPAAGAASRGEPVILESLIGQINGRPVFASEILEPLNDQLRTEAAKVKERREFRTFATKVIAESVWRVIKDELILAEARASLTPEQKQGLFQFLSKIQEDVVSQQRGSAVAADEALRAGSGQSLQQTAQDRLNRELIINEIRQRVAPRVIVSPRQIAQEYERNYVKYNPRPVAVYRLISVDAKNATVIEKVTAELAGGRPFGEIADDGELNMLAETKDAGRVRVQLTGEPDQELFSTPEQSAAARPLGVGQHAGPITVGKFVRWVLLESREQAPPVSLYDAQLQIESDLREARFQAETERYFDRLRKRGSVSSIEDMVVRLLYIAEQRYLTSAVQ